MRIYNTLTRKIEEFKPLNPHHVGMYTCGPTVYYYPHIGNWRTFVFDDILRRVLEYNDYKVTQVMNFTDVGHLTGDNLGNADIGEDRMEKAARREGRTAWEIADFYINDFRESLKQLNIQTPEHLERATDHIEDQINLIERLVKKGLAYKTETGVFFDVTKFPNYGKLGGQKLVDKRVATREELVDDKTKHHPADFALWKFSRPEDRRQMEWDSPWGRGFPGWHIECSAMSMKYLGESFDIHTGGVDHIAIHHTNEIAQSEGATGKPFVKYWLHGEFLTVDGGRMGKSLGNAYTLSDVSKKGFNPLVLRYFYLTAHYRTVLNFTWKSLENSQNSLNRLYTAVAGLKSPITGKQGVALLTNSGMYENEFLGAVNNDLNMPQAVAVVWRLVDDETIPSEVKLSCLLKMDQVLGLRLSETKVMSTQITKTLRYEVQAKANIKSAGSKLQLLTGIRQLVEEREKLRVREEFAKSDEVRKKIEEEGYTIEDTAAGTVIRKA